MCCNEVLTGQTLVCWPQQPFPDQSNIARTLLSLASRSHTENTVVYFAKQTFPVTDMVYNLINPV